MITISDMQKMAVSALGALLLSVTMVAAAVGPAHAVEIAPASALGEVHA